MKNQALFSSKDKSKQLKCRLLQFLFGALRLILSQVTTEREGDAGNCTSSSLIDRTIMIYNCLEREIYFLLMIYILLTGYKRVR